MFSRRKTKTACRLGKKTLISKNTIWAVEPDRKCCEILQQKGYKNIINTSFDNTCARAFFIRTILGARKINDKYLDSQA